MKIKKTLEQATYVLILLTLEKEHRPIKSVVLSKRLEVSDSYLKKVLRKLVVADIIRSVSSKDGGFTLARPIEEITLFDVFQAIEGAEPFLELTGLQHRIFKQEAFIETAEEKVLNLFQQAENDYLNKLKSFAISELLVGLNYDTGIVNWENLEVVTSND